MALTGQASEKKVETSDDELLRPAAHTSPAHLACGGRAWRTERRAGSLGMLWSEGSDAGPVLSELADGSERGPPGGKGAGCSTG